MHGRELHPGALPQFDNLRQADDLFAPMDWCALPFTPEPVLRIVEWWIASSDPIALSAAWALAGRGDEIGLHGWLNPKGATFYVLLSILKRRFHIPVEALFTAAYFVHEYRTIAP